MRRALTYIVMGAIACAIVTAAERKSWNKVRYMGGTVAVKTTPYDWNTTLTVSANPDTITITISPAKLFTPLQRIRLQPAQIVSLAGGPGAWRRVAEVSGVQLPGRPPTLFGVMLERHSYLGIIYESEGKKAAILLDSYSSAEILDVLKAMTGKEVEYPKE